MARGSSSAGAGAGSSSSRKQACNSGVAGGEPAAKRRRIGRRNTEEQVSEVIKKNCPDITSAADSEHCR
eukprot:7801903-Lingulodinium_polyedra.AAC.1